MDGFISVPDEIPARTVSKVGEQGVDAHLILRLQEHELGLAVFERDGIVRLDLYVSKRLAVSGHPVAQRNVIACVQERAACDHEDKHGLHVDKLYASRRLARRQQLRRQHSPAGFAASNQHPDNASMRSDVAPSEWNGFGRANAAQRWRRQSAAMGQHVTEAIVAEANIPAGAHVLDAACGTGEPAISVALLLEGTGFVAGVDTALESLRIAAQRARARGLGNVQFQQGDVHQLPFAANSFERVTSRLGVMFFSDLPRALREIHRVLKPQGRVTLLAWGPMQQPYFVTTIGTILSSIPGSRLPASATSMFKFGRPGILADTLQAAGFGDIEEKFPTLPWSWPGTPAEVWDYFQEVTVPFRPLLQSIPEEQRGEINARVLRAIARYYDGQKVNFTATVCLVSAIARKGH